MKNTIMYSGWFRAALMIFILTAAISGCSKDATPGADQVFMQNISFNPASITVAVNATVTWTNQDNVAHNVTSDSGWFASPNINPGGTYSHQFTAAGAIITIALYMRV